MTRAQAGCISVIVALWLLSASNGASCAQANPADAGGSIDLGTGRGAIAPKGSSRPVATDGRAENPIEFSFRAGLASDYIYRGVTLSAHEPAAGAAVELTSGVFYGG